MQDILICLLRFFGFKMIIIMFAVGNSIGKDTIEQSSLAERCEWSVI